MKDENTLCYLPFDDSVTDDECGNKWTSYNGEYSPKIYNTEESSDRTFKSQLNLNGGLSLSNLTFSPQKLTISLWIWIKSPLEEGPVQNKYKYIYKIKGKNEGPGTNYNDSFNNEISLYYRPHYRQKKNHLLNLDFDFCSIELFKYITVKFNSWHNIVFCIDTPNKSDLYTRNHYIFIDGRQVHGWTKVFKNKDYIKNDTWNIAIGSQSDDIDLLSNCYIKNFEISKIARSVGDIFNLNLTFNSDQLSENYGKSPGGLEEFGEEKILETSIDENADIPVSKNYIVNNNYTINNASNVIYNKAPFEMIGIVNNNSTFPKGNIIFLYPSENLDLSQYEATISYISNGGLVYKCSGQDSKFELEYDIGGYSYASLKSKSSNSTLTFRYNYGTYILFGTLEFWMYINFNNSDKKTVFKLTGNTMDDITESITINLSNTEWEVIPIFFSDNDISSYTKNGTASIQNTWTHIAISITGTYINIFINGKAILQLEYSLFYNILNDISFYLYNNINYITNIRFSDFIRYSSDNFDITMPKEPYNISDDITIAEIDPDNILSLKNNEA